MGFACARRLGRRMRVLLTDSSEAGLRVAVKRLEAEELQVSSVVCDITDAEAVQGLADEVSQPESSPRSSTQPAFRHR